MTRKICSTSPLESLERKLFVGVTFCFLDLGCAVSCFFVDAQFSIGMSNKCDREHGGHGGMYVAIEWREVLLLNVRQLSHWAVLCLHFSAHQVKIPDDGF